MKNAFIGTVLCLVTSSSVCFAESADRFPGIGAAMAQAISDDAKSRSVSDAYYEIWTSTASLVTDMATFGSEYFELRPGNEVCQFYLSSFKVAGVSGDGLISMVARSTTIDMRDVSSVAYSGKHGYLSVELLPGQQLSVGVFDGSDQSPSTGASGNILRNLHTFMDVFGKRANQSDTVLLYFGEKMKSTPAEEIDRVHLNLMSQFQRLIDVCRDI